MLREVKKILGLIIGLAGSALLVLLSQLLLARHLGPEDYGLLAASLALVAMMAPYVWLGMGGWWLSVFGREGWTALRWLPGSLRAGGITAPLAILVFSILVFYGFADHELGHLVLWLAPVLLMQALAYLSQVRWQLEHKYGLVTMSNALLPGLRAGVAILAILGSFSLEGVLFGLSLSATLIAIVLMTGLYRFIGGEIELAGHGQRPHRLEISVRPGKFMVLRRAWPFALQNSFEIMLLQLSVFMLAIMGSSEDAAMFSVALTFVNATFMIPTALFAGYLLPKLHRWAEHDRAKLLLTFRTTSSLMLIAGVAAGIAMFSIAPVIVPLVFGKAYGSAIPILQWLSMVIPLRFLSTALGNPLITGEHIFRRLRLIAISTAAALIVCLTFIPEHGAMAGVWGMLVGHFFLLILYGYGTVRHVLGNEALEHWFKMPKIS